VQPLLQPEGRPATEQLALIWNRRTHIPAIIPSGHFVTPPSAKPHSAILD
jgi:hypothetical protein